MRLAIHAGALFTDDGRFIKFMRANAKILAGFDRYFLGARAYRRVFRDFLETADPSAASSDAPVALQKLLPQEAPVKRAILTCAQFLGENETCIQDGQFYPGAGHRISRIAQCFPDAPVEVYIGLCNPAGFIPKALIQMSDDQRQNTLKTTDLSCLSWLTMIEDIRDFAPDAKITLWSNEESPLIWGDILCAIADLPEDTPLNRELGFLSSLVSDEGKHEIQDVLRRQDVRSNPKRREALAAILKEYAQPDAIEEDLDLPGWNEEIVASFTELYEQDLARLQSMPDIRFLTR